MKKHLTLGSVALLLILLAACSKSSVVTYPVVDTITDNSTVYHCNSITFPGMSFTASSSAGASAYFVWNITPANEGLYQIVSQYSSFFDNQVSLDLVTPNGNYDITPGQTVFIQIKTDGYGKKVIITTTKILMTNQSSGVTDTVNINASQQ